MSRIDRCGWGKHEPRALATLATWTMTLFIQRSEHRDTQADHAKLDELLRSDPGADTKLSQLDDEKPEQIEKVRRKRQAIPRTD